MSAGFPTSWLPVSFDDVFAQVSTSGKKVKTADTLAEGEFPVVDQGRTFISGYLDNANLVVSDDKPLIIFGDHTREIKWIDFPFIPGADGVQILKPHPEMDARFLYFFLRNLPIESKGYARHFKIVKDAEYLAPPLAEQTRIAAKLDELLAQVDTLKARIDAIPALLKRFRQSVLAAAVSGRLTEEWREFTTTESKANTAQLGELITEMRNGLSAKPNEDGKGLPILRISSVRAGSVDQADIRFLDCNTADKERYALRVGDLLFTRYNGSLELVGVCGLVRQLTHAALVYPDKLIRVRCETDVVLPEYLEIFFAETSVRQRVMDLVKSTSGQKGISGQDLKALCVTYPSLSEQTEIVRRVEQLFAFADQLEAKVASAKGRIDHLTQSILAKAFRGELVPQDPNDEPASVLLERIKTQRAAAPKAKRGRKASA
ncbi:restriction endonuclease subunit S [Pseudomonas fluvialis]|uniref:Restriction endonuclease subunit S n=1 Tax=Pseudomonas fluvialis TaxID=1793966 RepID=A0A2I0CP28_9PSED|nr:restriction endonuclease subunit S [Pseudomonas pharmacofabricae]PKF70907.1 restriction endonuclease subunit S [Pseudomonas pharmacofabricae]